jgi:hypothetical protein
VGNHRGFGRFAVRGFGILKLMNERAFLPVSKVVTPQVGPAVSFPVCWWCIGSEPQSASPARWAGGWRTCVLTAGVGVGGWWIMEPGNTGHHIHIALVHFELKREASCRFNFQI